MPDFFFWLVSPEDTHSSKTTRYLLVQRLLVTKGGTPYTLLQNDPQTITREFDALIENLQLTNLWKIKHFSQNIFIKSKGTVFSSQKPRRGDSLIFMEILIE